MEQLLLAFHAPPASPRPLMSNLGGRSGRHWARNVGREAYIAYSALPPIFRDIHVEGEASKASAKVSDAGNSDLTILKARSHAQWTHGRSLGERCTVSEGHDQ